MGYIFLLLSCLRVIILTALCKTCLTHINGRVKQTECIVILIKIFFFLYAEFYLQL